MFFWDISEPEWFGNFSCWVDYAKWDAHAALPDRVNDYIQLVDTAVNIHT